MITAETMDSLLANQAFRAFLAARTQGIPGDSREQQEAAEHVTAQIQLVRGAAAGTTRYNIACGALLGFIDVYLTEYGEHEPPYLPEGHERLGLG